MSDAINAFKKKLDSNGYKNIAGARRGIGKMQSVSEADKAKMQSLAATFFAGRGESADEGEKPTKQRVVKVPRKAAAKSAPAPTTNTKPAAAEKTTSPKKEGGRGRKKADPAVESAVASANDAHGKLNTLEQAITNLDTIRKAGVDVSKELEVAKRGISLVLSEIVGASNTIAPAPQQQPQAQQSFPSNGAVTGGFPGQFQGAPSAQPGFPSGQG